MSASTGSTKPLMNWPKFSCTLPNEKANEAGLVKSGQFIVTLVLMLGKAWLSLASPKPRVAVRFICALPEKLMLGVCFRSKLSTVTWADSALVCP